MLVAPVLMVLLVLLVPVLVLLGLVLLVRSNERARDSEQGIFHP